MKKVFLGLFVFCILFFHSLYSQDTDTRQAFNNLLFGLWKNSSGDIRSFENFQGKIVTLNSESKGYGYFVGEIMYKDFKYLGNNEFKFDFLFKSKQNGNLRSEWIKTKMTVTNNSYNIEALERSTYWFKKFDPATYYLVEKKTPPAHEMRIEPFEEIDKGLITQNLLNGLPQNERITYNPNYSSRNVSALSFNGKNSYVNIGNKSLFNITYNTTIEFWVCFFQGGSYNPRIISKGEDNWGYNGEYCIYTGGTGSTRKIYFWIANIGEIVTKDYFRSDTFYHLAATICGDRNSCQMKLYIDGELQSTGDFHGTLPCTSYSLVFGRKGKGSNYMDMFKGIIDEVRFWNYCRTQTQIQKCKNISLIGNESGLFSYWKFDEGSGVTAFDMLNYNNGLIINAIYENSNIPSVNDLCSQSITWITPSNTSIETNDFLYKIKASIKSTKKIKKIQVMLGDSSLSTETNFYLSNGQGTFEKGIILNSGNNEIFLVSENEDCSIKSEKLTIKYNEPQVPPMLSLSYISFMDKNGNNRIDGNEDCYISFTIVNKGNGSARNLKVNVQNNSNVQGLIFNNTTTFKYIAPNASQNVNIPIVGSMNLTSGTANIKVGFEEQMGFPPDPFILNIVTKEFIKPVIKVVDHSFLTDNGFIKLGMPIQLKVLIQNVGQGTAENVNVSFSYPSSNVFSNGQKEFIIGIMQAGATKEIIFEFIANKLYAEKLIPITIKVNEKFGKFSENEEVVANIETKSSGNTINIASNANDNIVNIQIASLSADIDRNIPQNAIKYPNRYALIIGNEDYTSRQTGLNTESNVAYAANDAKIFKEYCVNTFGVEEKNIYLLLNGTAGEMSQKIELITQILTRLGESGELIFYYAGHGFPDENTKIPYLIPVDVSATNLQSAIKLSDLYQKLSQTKAKQITIFLDACFTGGGRDQGLIAARGIRIKPLKDNITGNMVVFAATSDDQSALPYTEKQHGFFTYYLLKKLQETKGDVTYEELSKYLKTNVSLESLRINNKPQYPSLQVSVDVQNTWSQWRIK